MIELLATIKKLNNSGLKLTDTNDKLSSFKEVGVSENQLNNLDKSLNENKTFNFSDAGINKEVMPLNYDEASFNKLLNNGTFDNASNKVFAVNQEFYKQPMDVINKIQDTVSANGGEIKSFDFKDQANNWSDKSADKDTLGKHITDCKPHLNEANINKLKGNIAEKLMDWYFKSSGWTKINGEIGVNGIDGLYVKYDKLGNVSDVLISESKYNTSQLGKTLDGKQTSKDWILKKIEILELAHPDNKAYGQIKALVSEDKYRARLFKLSEIDNKLNIEIKKIDSTGSEVHISSLSGAENYKINKTNTIDLNNPSSDYQQKIAGQYNKIVDAEITKGAYRNV